MYWFGPNWNNGPRVLVGDLPSASLSFLRHGGNGQKGEQGTGHNTHALFPLRSCGHIPPGYP